MDRHIAIKHIIGEINIALDKVADIVDYLKSEAKELNGIESQDGNVIKFKTPGERKEFEKIDIRLKIILLALASYLKFYCSYTLIITELLRTQKEQDEIYGDNSNYKSKPWKSVHQYGRGADISIRGMNEATLQATDSFLNSFVYSGAKFKSRKKHDVGRGNHFHVQVDFSGVTEISAKGEDNG